VTGWVVVRIWHVHRNARSDDYDLDVLSYPVPMLGRKIEVLAGPFSVYEDARRDLLRRYGAPI